MPALVDRSSWFYRTNSLSLVLLQGIKSVLKKFYTRANDHVDRDFQGNLSFNIVACCRIIVYILGHGSCRLSFLCSD